MADSKQIIWTENYKALIDEVMNYGGSVPVVLSSHLVVVFWPTKRIPNLINGTPDIPMDKLSQIQLTTLIAYYASQNTSSISNEKSRQNYSWNSVDNLPPDAPPEI